MRFDVVYGCSVDFEFVLIGFHGGTMKGNFLFMKSILGKKQMFFNEIDGRIR